MPLGGDYWQADTGPGLWGFADLHVHLMAHLAFGGRMFWGQPYDPERVGDAAMATALASCEPAHGGLLNPNMELLHAPGGGWPDFAVWPRFTTLAHQQVYVDWLYRAYQGGLRLICGLAVNNEVLSSRFGVAGAGDDMAAVTSQIAAMKEMVATVERQAGGPAHAWLQIAYSPEEARDIIANNRLAMILGVEVDSLGNWRRFEDLHVIAGQDPDAPRRLIAQLLDELHALGIRQITPLHMTNNAFGGTAIYMRLLDATNLVLTGRHYKVEDGWHTGVRYRLDLDGAGHPTETIGRMLALQGERLSPERGQQRGSLLHRLPIIKGLVQALERPTFTGGHVNAFGLTRYGVILIEELMARGMIIDIDHMSQKTTDLVLALAEGYEYPLICSHAWFRDLAFSADVQFDPNHPEAYGTSDMHKVAHEAGKRGDQIERIGRLGGVVAPILNQGDLAGLARALPEQARKIAAPCAGFEHGVGRSLSVRAGEDGRTRRGDRQRCQRRRRPPRTPVRHCRGARCPGRHGARSSATRAD